MGGWGQVSGGCCRLLLPRNGLNGRPACRMPSSVRAQAKPPQLLSLLFSQLFPKCQNSSLAFRRAANAPFVRIAQLHLTFFPRQSADLPALCPPQTTGPTSSSETEPARVSALRVLRGRAPCGVSLTPWRARTPTVSTAVCVRTGVSDDTHSSGRVSALMSLSLAAAPQPG